MAKKEVPPVEVPESGDQSALPESAPPGDAPANAEDSNPVAPAESSDSASLSNLTESHMQTYEGFDPSIHATNEDGTPKRKVDGTYALKRGRKAGSAAASALPPKNAAQKAVAGAPGVSSPATITLDEAARQSANMVINVAVWTLGEEVGKPNDKAEAEGLKLSFKNYYEARGVPNIPPEIGLVMALGSYIGPRLMHEKSRTKMERIGAWIHSKLHK